MKSMYQLFRDSGVTLQAKCVNYLIDAFGYLSISLSPCLRNCYKQIKYHALLKV